MTTAAQYIPVEIKRLGPEGLQIQWADGSTHTLSSKILRENCPSADSKAARGDTSHEKPLSAKPASLSIVTATADEATHLEQIWPVGNYAIGIRWKDGHDTGIYTYSFLYSLGETL